METKVQGLRQGSLQQSTRGNGHCMASCAASGGSLPCHSRNRVVDIGRRFIGIEEHAAMRYPRRGVVGVDTRQARIHYPRAGEQVNHSSTSLFPTRSPARPRDLGFLTKLKAGSR